MTRPPSDSELDAFFRQGQSWASDREDQGRRSRRIAWSIAGVATTIAALEAIALAGLTPLKTVVPYTVLVDRQTGHVTTLDPSQPLRLNADSALAKSMLAQYVVARESLDRSSIAGDYRKVALWSGETARTSYLALMKPDNPDNPLARLPGTSLVEPRIKSVSLLEDGSALVRYDLIRTDQGGAASAPAPYVSVIRYRFRDRPLAESDRYINPLGFEVTRYRRDPETAPAAVEVAPSSSAAATSPLVSTPSNGSNGARP